MVVNEGTEQGINMPEKSVELPAEEEDFLIKKTWKYTRFAILL